MVRWIICCKETSDSMRRTEPGREEKEEAPSRYNNRNRELTYAFPASSSSSSSSSSLQCCHVIRSSSSLPHERDWRKRGERVLFFYLLVFIVFSALLLSVFCIFCVASAFFGAKVGARLDLSVSGPRGTLSRVLAFKNFLFFLIARSRFKKRPKKVNTVVRISGHWKIFLWRMFGIYRRWYNYRYVLI